MLTIVSRSRPLPLNSTDYHFTTWNHSLTASRYCVRPNSGRIDPKKDVEVQVLLQAMKEDPPLDAKCRDKFLVQSIAISADNEFTNVQQVVRSRGSQ